MVSRLFAMDLPVDKGEGKRAIQVGPMPCWTWKTQARTTKP